MTTSAIRRQRGGLIAPSAPGCATVLRMIRRLVTILHGLQTLAGPLLILALLAPSGARAESGKVKFFNEQKGFGFIKPKSGPDVFMHKSATADGKGLPVGACVEFDLGQGPKGPRASNVRKVDCK